MASAISATLRSTLFGVRISLDVAKAVIRLLTNLAHHEAVGLAMAESRVDPEELARTLAKMAKLKADGEVSMRGDVLHAISLAFDAIVRGACERVGTTETVACVALCENRPLRAAAMMAWMRASRSTVRSLKEASCSERHMARFTRRCLTERRFFKKIGRNDPCMCGSGRKWKKCCLSESAVEPPAVVVEANEEVI